MNNLTNQEREKMVKSVDLTIRHAAARIGVRALGKSYYDDCYQEGSLGAWRAAINWEPGGGSKFSTYATLVIRRHVIDYVDRQNRIKYSDELEDKECLDSIPDLSSGPEEEAER